MLKFFNTLSRKKELFFPLEEGRVKLYTCGPSVYDTPHLGNYRTYAFEDTLKRYLEFKGFEVFHVMNVTDVEDKAIRAAKKDKISLKELTNRYLDIFLKDMDLLKIKLPNICAIASEHIKDAEKLVKILLNKGLAYKDEKGNVFYDISKFKGYGMLSKIKLTDKMLNRRVTKDDYQNWEAGDYVLWKAWKKSDGEVYWESYLGKGRPGWHLEDTAIALRYLGDRYDIHCGGADNVFPHHENLIAQNDGVTGHKTVNYWLHCRHLIIEGRKMSKRTGNVVYPQDLISKGFTPEGIRYLFYSTHYRRRLNFTMDEMRKAEEEVKRLNGFIKSLKIGGNEYIPEIKEEVDKLIKDFEKSMDDDLNTVLALKAISNMIENLGKYRNVKLSKDNYTEIMETIKRVNSVLPIFQYYL